MYAESLNDMLMLEEELIKIGYWRNFWFFFGKPFRKVANKIQNVDIWINRNIA